MFDFAVSPPAVMIEELTLYIIDQDKKISNMQSQIDELKALIKK